MFVFLRSRKLHQTLLQMPVQARRQLARGSGLRMPLKSAISGGIRGFFSNQCNRTNVRADYRSFNASFSDDCMFLNLYNVLSPKVYKNIRLILQTCQRRDIMPLSKNKGFADWIAQNALGIRHNCPTPSVLPESSPDACLCSSCFHLSLRYVSISCSRDCDFFCLCLNRPVSDAQDELHLVLLETVQGMLRNILDPRTTSKI